MSKCGVTIEGLTVPLVTPVTERGDVDIDGMVKLAGWLVGKGVHGLFVGGTTGRFSYFSPKQTAEACRAVSQAFRDKVTIFGGACDSGPHRVIANAELMKEAGAHVIVATGPFYLPYSVEEVEACHLEVANRSPLPVVIYNMAPYLGYTLRPEWLAEMADHPNVVGYKDTSGEFPHHLEVLKLTKGKDFTVLIGKELLVAKALRAGAKGLVVSFANSHPEPFVEIFESAKRGDWAKVEECQRAIDRIVEAAGPAMTRRPYFSTLMEHLENELRGRGIQLRLR